MDMTGAVDPWRDDPQRDQPIAPDFSRMSARVAEREAYEIKEQLMGRE
jgi:hypothetical protein